MILLALLGVGMVIVGCRQFCHVELLSHAIGWLGVLLVGILMFGCAVIRYIACYGH
jgi:hypothetical protein